MSSIRLAVNGATGRMGSRILALASEDEQFEIVSALEHADHPHQGRDVGPLVGLPPIHIPLSGKLQGAPDVLIDFSTPTSTKSRLEEYRTLKTALVIGTTGFDDETLQAIDAASQELAILLEPNMSAGVHLLIETAARIARFLGPSHDIEILEAHHGRKVDAPSGTALKLLDRVAEALGRDPEQSARHGRSGRVGPRTKAEIGLHAIRGGDIVGEHTVLFAGLGESIELVHRASSRDTFASGALRAARFLAGRPPGRYRIEDVLGL